MPTKYFSSVSIILVMLGLSGCGQWVKPGASQQEREITVTRCKAIAYQRLPAAMVPYQISGGYYQSGEKKCSTDANGNKTCKKTNDTYIPPNMGTKDANEDGRDAIIGDCMHSSGWTWSQ